MAAGLVALTLATAAAAAPRDPDRRDRGEFWAEVVSPHRAQVGAIKLALRDALGVLTSDWSPEQRERVVAEATRLARHARTLAPDDPELGYYLGALADEAGLAGEAARRLAEFAARAPRGPARTDALLRLGRLALRRGEPAAALGPLRQALGERADRRSSSVAAVYLAHALDGVGRTGDAVELLSLRVEAGTGSWEAEDALEWLTLAVIYDRDEQITHAFDLVVRAQQALSGSYAERLEAGLALAPPVPAAELHYHRAFLYETAGFLHEARAEWLAYVRLPTALAPARARAHLAALDRLLAERRPGRAPAPAGRRRAP